MNTCQLTIDPHQKSQIYPKQQHSTVKSEQIQMSTHIWSSSRKPLHSKQTSTHVSSSHKKKKKLIHLK